MSIRTADPVSIVFAATLTSVIHVGVILVMFTLAVLDDDEVEAPPTIALPVIDTELLMWGERMPNPGELPRIANPEEAPDIDTPPPIEPPQENTALPDQETVSLNPNPNAPQRPEENRQENEPQPENAQLRQNRGETNPNRPTNTDLRAGSPDGFFEGTSLSATAVANQFSRIIQQLSRALRKPAGISDAEYRRLKAVVDLRISAEGRVLSWEMVDGSGNNLFDTATESMLNRFRLGDDRLMLSTIADAQLRQIVVSQGLRVTIVGQ